MPPPSDSEHLPEQTVKEMDPNSPAGIGTEVHDTGIEKEETVWSCFNQ
jgi:hypothetical protein